MFLDEKKNITCNTRSYTNTPLIILCIIYTVLAHYDIACNIIQKHKFRIEFVRKNGKENRTKTWRILILSRFTYSNNNMQKAKVLLRVLLGESKLKNVIVCTVVYNINGWRRARVSEISASVVTLGRYLPTDTCR